MQLDMWYGGKHVHTDGSRIFVARHELMGKGGSKCAIAVRWLGHAAGQNADALKLDLWTRSAKRCVCTASEGKLLL